MRKRAAETESTKRAGVRGPAKRLSREDWVEAALQAVERGGLGQLAVEPLAAALGTTKGSFYWHFGDRRELLAAALQRWVERDTEQVIARVEELPDPATKLSTILTQGLAGRFGGAVDAALLASADDPLVADALDRGHRRRLAYTEGLFAALGLEPEEARRRALLCYAVYVGHLQLRRAAPELSAELAEKAYVEHVRSAIVDAAGTAGERHRRRAARPRD